MNKVFIIAAVVGIGLWWLGGCTGHTQRTPTLSAPPVGEAAAAERKGFLENAGDTTWNVVTAPARLVSGVGAKKPAPKAPETYEPAEAVIVIGGAGGAADSGQPESTNATTRPSGQ